MNQKFPSPISPAFRSFILPLLLVFSVQAFSQNLPSPSSCTSKDLELVSATLPPPGNDPCACSGTRTLMLSINNKTGSTRTSFAFWGTVEIYNADGSLASSTAITGCNGPIAKNSITTLPFGTITRECNQSVRLVNLFLAWTDASPKSTCPLDPATINPKCGTLPGIQVFAGVDGTLDAVNATCTAGGSITVSPFGGKSPYTVTLKTTPNVVRTNVTTSTTFSNLPAGTYTVDIKDANNCITTKMRTVGSAAAPTANAGDDFTKTCNSNTSGKQIGESPVTGFSYSWSPATGLSATNVSNPTANPGSTTTYTVTKTETATGCFGTDMVTVTVNTTAPTADAGADFTKTCTSNASGKQIGESPVAGFSYSWSPTTGLSASNIANPTANPASSTTYTVTKTNTTTGCFGTDDVSVTVDNAPVTANAGADFTKTCTSNASGKQIGESPMAGFSYSWSPTTGLSASNIANPTANPSSSTTYTVTKTNTTTGCFGTDDVSVTVDNAPVTANAGADFTKTCTTNASGKQIGESPMSGFSYSWSPTTGLSASNIANPTANPASSTTYTVTKTNTTTGCFGTDDVSVTVDNAPVTANAGADFTKTCTSNASGKQIGESPMAGFSYSWSPTTGLSASNIANPTANPSSSTTYTVTKTNTTTGCFGTDDVTVTVDNTMPDPPAFCVVQPSLCGPSTGSVTITSPLGADYQYSIDDGATWQSSPSFTNVAAGSVTGIKVKIVSSGCISSAASCDASSCEAPSQPVTNASDAKTDVLSPSGQPQARKTVLDFNDPANEPSVKAFPNPFSDKVKFVITSPVSGKGTLDIYNNLGQKIRNLYTGYIAAGTQTIDVNMPAQRNRNMMYILMIGDKKMTGKLMQVNK